MPVRTISTRLAIEGDAKYRSKLSNINAELGSLQSQVKLVNAQYQNHQNSTEALTAKSSALAAVQAAQTQKIKTLEEALANARASQEKFLESQAETKTKLDANNKALDDLGTGARKNGRLWNSYADQVAAAEAELESLRSSSSDTTTQEAALEKQIQETKEKMAALETATGGTASKAGALVKENTKLKSELSNAASSGDAAARGAANYGKQLNNARIQAAYTNAEIERTRKYLDEAQESADGCARSIDEFGHESKNAGEESQAAFESLASAVAALGVTQAIDAMTDAIETCTSAAVEFEYSMAKVQTIADTSSYAWSTMSADILDLSLIYGRSASGMAEAAYQALSASVDTANAIEFLDTATQLSIGGYTSTTTAVDVLTTAINSYGMAADQAAHISDVLITTQNLGKTSVDQLAQNMGRTIPTAGAYNVSLENLASSYALLTKNGIATAESTTYISGMLNELGDTGSAVSKTLQEKTGKSFSDLSAEGWSLGDVMDSLLQSVNGDLTAFANLWSSAEAGKAAIKLAQVGAEEYNRILDQMTNNAGAASAAYQIMGNAVQASGERMQTASEAMQIAVGQALTPALETLQDVAAAAFTWIAEAVTDTPELAGAVTGLTVTIGGLTAGIVALSAAQKATSAVSAVWSSAVTAMSTPVGGAVMAITALIAVIGGLAIAASTDSSELKKLEDATKDLAEQVTASAEAYQTLTQNNKQAASNNQEMLSTLIRLSEQENKSAADKEQILSLVNQLNAAVPELNLAYDDQADALNLTGDEIDRYLRSMAKQTQYQADVARMNQLYSESLELNQKLADAQELLNEAIAKRDSTTDETWGAYNFEVDRAAKSVETLSDEIELNAQAYEDAKTAVNEAAAAMEGSSKSTEAAEAASEELETRLEDLQNAYEEVREAAVKSLEDQYSAWDKVEEGAKMSSKEIMAALESQTKHWKDYDTNLNKVLTSGVVGIEDFVASVADGSADSASYLASLAQCSKDELADVVDSWQGTQEAQESAAASIAKLSPEYAAAYQAVSQAVAQTNLESVSKAKFLAAMQAAREGIAAEQPSVVRAATEVGTVSADAFALTWSDTRALGESFALGALSGVQAKQGTLKSGMQSVGSESKRGFVGELSASEGKNAGSTYISGAVSGMDSKKGSARSKAKEIAQATKASFNEGNSSSKMYAVGRDLMEGFRVGSNSKLGTLKSTVKSIARSILTQMKSTLGVHSPSTEFADIARYSVEGFVAGFSSNAKAMEQVAASSAKSTMSAFEDSLALTAPDMKLQMPTAEMLHGASNTSNPVLQVLEDIRNALQSGGTQELIINVKSEIDGTAAGESVIRYINHKARTQGASPLYI